MSSGSYLPNQFIVKCKDELYLTYAVYDSEAQEHVDGTEDTNLVNVEQCAKKLNVEEFDNA